MGACMEGGQPCGLSPGGGTISSVLSAHARRCSYSVCIRCTLDKKKNKQRKKNVCIRCTLDTFSLSGRVRLLSGTLTYPYQDRRDTVMLLLVPWRF